VSSFQRSASQVCTYPPNIVSPVDASLLPALKGTIRWMGQLGNVSGLAYSSNCPGGAKDLSFTLARPPTWRTDALNPGRVTEVWRGGSRIWEGILDEPVPGATGWSVTAHGAGTYGDSFMAEYATWNLDNPLDRAINRGLRWRKPAFGSSVGWTGNVQNNASITITDFLNNATIQAGLLWHIDTRQGNLLSIEAPANVWAPDRLLVSAVPNPRTLAAGLNRLWYSYISSDDGSGNQVTTTVPALNGAAIDQWGAQEQCADMTSAGLMTSALATSRAQSILNQYVRANYTQGFTVNYGQYLTMGGSPVDLGCETAAPHVAKVLLTDGSYGGEVISSPVCFQVGEFDYDDDTQTATVTPYQSYKSDLSTLLTAVVPALRQ